MSSPASQPTTTQGLAQGDINWQADGGADGRAKGRAGGPISQPSVGSAVAAEPLRHAVVVVGGMNLDITALASQAAQLGDSTPGKVSTAPGGVGRNIAENLGRLGLDVQLISAVGDDGVGQQLLDACQRAGVGVQGVQVLASYPSATYLSVHGPDGVLLHAVNDMAVLQQLTPQRLLTQAALLDAAGWWVVDANLSPAALDALLQRTGTRKVLADGVSAAKCLRLLPHLPSLHLLKVNRLEACALLDWPLQQLQTVPDAQVAARALVAKGVQQVVLSMGAEGAVWFSACDGEGRGEVEGFCPTLPVPVKSTTGGGDALMAGLVWGLAQGWSLARSVPWAMACAAFTVQETAANHPQLSVQAVQGLLVQVPGTAAQQPTAPDPTVTQPPSKPNATMQAPVTSPPPSRQP